MIVNELQYRITKAQVDRFSRTLHHMKQRTSPPEGVHPRIAQAQVEAVASQIAALEGQLQEYENRRTTDEKVHSDGVISTVSCDAELSQQ